MGSAASNTRESDAFRMLLQGPRIYVMDEPNTQPQHHMHEDDEASKQAVDITGISSPFSAIIASVPARNGIADGATWRRFSHLKHLMGDETL